MSEYDDLIEQAAAQLAGCIISPTPEREAALGRFIGEALRLRYGRPWVSRDDAIDLWWDVVETASAYTQGWDFAGPAGQRSSSNRARTRRRDTNDAAGAH